MARPVTADGKNLKKSETKVKQTTLDQIRKEGMSKTIAKYQRGEGDSEFRTAVERYYAPSHLKKNTSPVSSAPAPPAKPASSPSTASPPTQNAVSRRLDSKKSKPVGSGVLGQKNAEWVNRNVSKPVSGVAAAAGATRAINADRAGQVLSSAKKKLGLNNPFKPRRRR